MIMDLKKIKLCTNEAGHVILQKDGFVALDCEAQTLMCLPNDENVRKHFDITLQKVDDVEHGKEYHIEESENAAAIAIKQQASWKDDNAVKALISEWKLHENKFKSTAVTNNKVWDMIAAKLIRENPFWEYTGKQCENKFKDVRKNYTKTRDNNVNRSGQDLQTCKFYDEMDTVLRDKPIIKFVAVASTLKIHKRSISQSASDSSEKWTSEEEVDNPQEAKEGKTTNKKSEIPKKKSKVSKELEKWALLQQEAAVAREQAKERRHEERMRRQDEAIMAYQTAMNKLLDKL